MFSFISFHLDFSYVTLLEGRETSLELNKKSKQEKKKSLNYIYCVKKISSLLIGFSGIKCISSKAPECILLEVLCFCQTTVFKHCSN